jgi:predicted glycosyltransferase
MRPLIAAMRADGHDVEVTARTFAQTLELCERFGIAHAAIGRHRGLGSFTVPELAVDAQSLVAYADLVVSAGGTMNREAVALGTPVYTTFEGRLGAVDEALFREGRLRRIGDPGEIVPERRRPQGGLRIRRDPRELVKLLLSAIDS